MENQCQGKIEAFLKKVKLTPEEIEKEEDSYAKESREIWARDISFSRKLELAHKLKSVFQRVAEAATNKVLKNKELALIDRERELPSCTLLELKEAYERGWDLVTDDKSVPADIDLEVRQWAGWSEIGKLLDVKYKEAGFLPVIFLKEVKE